METIYEILSDELTNLGIRIAQNIVKNGQYATGKTVQSIMTEMDGAYHGRLVGRKFFSALETGRARTKVTTPSNPTLQERILEWLIAKGITPTDGKSELSLSWAIARKIHKQGTKLFREGGRTDVYSNEIPQTITNIQSRVMYYFKAQAHTINEDVKEYYKNKAAL